MAYLKPQSPLRDKKSGNYFYPLTTEDQVVMEDGKRLSGTSFLTVDKNGSNIAEPNPINADTLKGTTLEDLQKYMNNQINEKVIYHKSRNLLHITPDSQTINGVTYTVNKDKSITINGTAGEGGSAFEFGGIYLAPCYIPKNSRIICDYESIELDFDTGYGIYTFLASNQPIFGSAAINAKLAESDCNFIGLAYFVAPGTTINNITIHPMILAPGDTDETYEPYYNGLTESSMSMELLWENASFTGSEFVPQEVALSSSILNYDMFIFTCVYDSTIPIFCNIISELTYPIPTSNGYTLYYLYLSTSFGGIQLARQCNIACSDTEVIFGIGYGMLYEPGSSNAVEDNTVLIPYRIYGIKR